MKFNQFDNFYIERVFRIVVLFTTDCRGLLFSPQVFIN